MKCQILFSHFMQIVSNGDNLHEMSNPVFWEKKNIKNITKMLSAGLTQRVVMVKYSKVKIQSR